MIRTSSAGVHAAGGTSDRGVAEMTALGDENEAAAADHDDHRPAKIDSETTSLSMRYCAHAAAELAAAAAV